MNHLERQFMAGFLMKDASLMEKLKGKLHATTANKRPTGKDLAVDGLAGFGAGTLAVRAGRALSGQSHANPAVEKVKAVIGKLRPMMQGEHPRVPFVDI